MSRDDQADLRRDWTIHRSVLKPIHTRSLGDAPSVTHSPSLVLVCVCSTSSDPHTAVAVHVANSLLASDAMPVIVSSTAHYAKFPNAMCQALGRPVPPEDATNLPRMLQHLASIATDTYRASMHTQLAKLVDRPTLHNTHCPADRASVITHIKEFLHKFAKKQ
jgi:hypothetical protein